MNVFLVTSVINTSTIPLSYTPTRSVYTHEQRYKQTIETIQSIRKYAPNAYIVLIEGSRKRIADEQCATLAADHIHFSDHQDIDSPHKAKGESHNLLSYLSSDHFQSLNAQRFFKLTGRYKLTSDFHFDKFLDDKIHVKFSGGSICTVLFSVPCVQKEWFIQRLMYVQQHCVNSIENTLFQEVIENPNDSRFHIEHALGFVGYCAVDGTIIQG